MSPRLTAMPPRLASPAPRIGPTQGDARAQDRERERVKPWRAWYRTARWSKLRRKILARAGHVCEQTGGPLLGRAPERACSDARQRCRRSASSHHVPRQASTCFRSVSIRIVLVNLYSQESKSEAAAARIPEKGLSGVKPISATSLPKFRKQLAPPFSTDRNMAERSPRNGLSAAKAERSGTILRKMTPKRKAAAKGCH
ncbi:hypothetical protein [Rhodovulum sulfidophilum]|uniref:Uncharacterized protein n=1 Tax=Rhodovulum sulfidophilum TaxID=35806 RepID=A0ABS1RX42_RHOSU|nr:hypothetical protein [Rhodovulum sulfidophilum]MBL3610667.1 hypothetical protein [Rhodovulum sulfidophilum]